MEFHDAANIFPLDEENIPELAADIKKHGLQVPIETLDGKIIDGRRRWTACQKAKVTPQFKAIATDDPVAHVLSLNLHRRHLTSSQLAMVGGRAVELYERYGEEAKKRQKARKGNQPGASVDTEPHLPKVRTRDKVGEAFGISGRTVGAAKKVLEQGIPELIDAVDEGKIPVRIAEKIADLEKDAQRETVGNPKAHQTFKQEKKQEPEEEAKPSGKQVGVGVIRANEAINSLTRIPKNDPLRQRGLQLVKDWIRHNQ